MLTLDILRAQANAASFSKGRAYFEEGAVQRLRYLPDESGYTATVSGSDEYGVHIGPNAENGPDFWCNCPYNYEGSCKHCVAVGLAVLEMQQQQPTNAQGPLHAMAGRKPGPAPVAAGPAAPPETAPEPVSASELEAALRDVPRTEQLKFLALHLRQNAALARAFLTQFVGPPLPPDPLDADSTLPRLETLRDELRKALSRLRFDYNALADANGNPPRVTYAYNTNSRFLAELLARINSVLYPVLGPAAGAMCAALAAGRLAEGLRRWYGAWLGISGLRKPANDSYDLFMGGYYARQVADTWLALLPETGVTELLTEQPFAAAEVARCLPVFVRAVLEPPAPAAPPEVVGRGRSVAPPVPLPNADLVLLLAAARNPSIAPALRTALAPYPHRLMPELQLALAAGCHDWVAWEPLARRMAP